MELALLIIAYKRSENLRRILEISYEAGLRHFYVKIDGLKVGCSGDDLIKQAKIYEELEMWRSDRTDCSLEINSNSVNEGCSATVLRGVDWISQRESQFCILEDDCIPSIDFFIYVRDGLRVLSQQNDVVIISGNQFAPFTLTNNCWQLSHYALTWGWAINSKNWERLRILIKKPQVHNSFNPFDYESCYWRAGSRRARLGFVDVWDTILVATLFENKLYSLIPGSNLVVNVGNDMNATHTIDDTTWLNMPLGKYISCEQPFLNSNVEDWIKRHFYKISFRHIFSTRLTLLLDFLGFHRKKVLSLHERWK